MTFLNWNIVCICEYKTLYNFYIFTSCSIVSVSLNSALRAVSAIRDCFFLPFASIDTRSIKRKAIMPGIVLMTWFPKLNWWSIVSLGFFLNLKSLRHDLINLPNVITSSIVLSYSVKALWIIFNQNTVFSSLKYRYLIIVYLLLKIRVFGEKKSILIKFFHQ